MEFYKRKMITNPNMLSKVKSPVGGYVLKVSSIYYSSPKAGSELCILDADMDPVLFKIPGQIDPKPTLFSDTLVKMPMYLMDKGDSPNEVIITGELVSIDNTSNPTYS